jgi:hypothetical protein
MTIRWFLCSKRTIPSGFTFAISAQQIILFTPYLYCDRIYGILCTRFELGSCDPGAIRTYPFLTWKPDHLQGPQILQANFLFSIFKLLPVSP